MTEDLAKLIEQSRAYTASLSREAYLEMIRKQGEGWVKAEASWPCKYRWVNGVKVYESYADYCA